MSTDVSSDRAIRQAYEADSSGLQLIPDLVARPETIDDVIELVKKAAAERTPVTSAGAQTSTTGASITDTGILLSLRSLNQISDLDVKSRTVRVGPGAIVADIKKTVAAAGLLFAPDPTSEGRVDHRWCDRVQRIGSAHLQVRCDPKACSRSQGGYGEW